MVYQKVLILTDNLIMYKLFPKLLSRAKVKGVKFTYRYSSKNVEFRKKFARSKTFLPIDANKEEASIVKKYDLLLSLHCKQIFSEALVRQIKCINIHPGYNPYNRGWSPQVFSIINGKQLGATIHEIDSSIDHGPIIAQKKVSLTSWDTSQSAYLKVLRAEQYLIVKHIKKILDGNYHSLRPIDEGNINYLKDYTSLFRLDLNKIDTMLNTINLLRALSHGNYKNAYFIDRDGNKIFVKVSLTKVKASHAN